MQRKPRLTRADDPVFGGTGRQVDHRHRYGVALERTALAHQRARLACLAANGERQIAAVAATEHRTNRAAAMR